MKALPASRTAVPAGVRAICGLAIALAAGGPAGAAGPVSPEHLELVSGRHQLFLDDFVLGHLYRVERIIHSPHKYEGNPVIRPDLPTDGTAIEMPDGPSWDEREKVWKVWYWADGDASGCGFAWSRDGLHWIKPVLGLVDRNGNRNNNLVTVRGEPAAFIQNVFLDAAAPPERRYKGVIGPAGRRPVVSADGFRFTALKVPPIPSEDTSHLTWDSLQNQYLLTVKHNGPFGRSVYLSLSRDFEKWTSPELIYAADATDEVLGAQHIREIEANPRMWRPTINHPSEYNTEIYNMPIFVYEGLYIGMPTYFESSGLIAPPRGNQDGTNSVKLACSRDLRAWTRIGNRSHFIPVSELGGAGDTGQILAASHPIRMGDELWFYYSGYNVRYRPNVPNIKDEFHGAIYLAKLRLDGFVSFRAGDDEGIIETRPVRFGGSRLFVNADASRGQIQAEITDPSGRSVLPGWGLAESIPVAGDSLQAELRWKGRSAGELAGKVVRIRFHLRHADLYSFWPRN